MQITILTGFRDFEYAREAIRLGVTRFLLKPSKMEELEEAVEVMVKNLSGRKDGEEEEKKVSLTAKKVSLGLTFNNAFDF